MVGKPTTPQFSRFDLDGAGDRRHDMCACTIDIGDGGVTIAEQLSQQAF
jgi:hypothetical protein